MRELVLACSKLALALVLSSQWGQKNLENPSTVETIEVVMTQNSCCYLNASIRAQANSKIPTTHDCQCNIVDG